MIVFFSLGGNTRRFVEKTGIENIEIPLSEPLVVERPYILVTPTYAHGLPPAPVRLFLERGGENWKYMKGVIATGNTNFFDQFGAAADYISSHYNVPALHKIEISGFPEDVQIVIEGMRKWLK